MVAVNWLQWCVQVSKFKTTWSKLHFITWWNRIVVAGYCGRNACFCKSRCGLQLQLWCRLSLLSSSYYNRHTTIYHHEILNALSLASAAWTIFLFDCCVVVGASSVCLCVRLFVQFVWLCVCLFVRLFVRFFCAFVRFYVCLFACVLPWGKLERYSIQGSDVWGVIIHRLQVSVVAPSLVRTHTVPLLLTTDTIGNGP
jgi:hypothetical protein